MTLDTRTLFMVLGILTAFDAVALAFFRATRKTYPGFGLWTACNVAVAAGFLGIALRGPIPVWLSVIVANSLLALGAVWRIYGVRLFLGQPGHGRSWYGLPLLLSAAPAVFYFIWDLVTLRVLLVTVSTVLPLAVMARDFFRSPLCAGRTFKKFLRVDRFDPSPDYLHPAAFLHF